MYPTNDRARAALEAQAESEESGSPHETRKLRRDHINDLGLPNDGYDYSQHMRTIGGGRLISGPTGGIVDAADDLRSKAVVLPAEAMPSGEKEVDRMLEAITISEDCMDEDLCDALFNEDAVVEVRGCGVIPSTG